MNKNVKEDSKKQNPYQLDKLSRIPSWLIILLLKYWAAAAAVFFSVIGGVDIGFNLDEVEMDPVNAFITSVQLIIFIAVFITLFINYIVRPFVRMMYNKRINTYRYNMINIKGILSFVLCFGYHIILSVILYFITILLSKYGLVLDLFGTTGGIGIEPFTYAFCYIVVDFIFLFIKDAIWDYTIRLKYKKQMEMEL